MKEGKISNGFEYAVDEKRMDDMEFIDALSDTSTEDPTSISIVVKKLLGKEQRKRLYDYLREEDGRVPIEKTMDAVSEILDAMGDDGKN